MIIAVIIDLIWTMDGRQIKNEDYYCQEKNV